MSTKKREGLRDQIATELREAAAALHCFAGYKAMSVQARHYVKEAWPVNTELSYDEFRLFLLFVAESLT